MDTPVPEGSLADDPSVVPAQQLYTIRFYAVYAGRRCCAILPALPTLTDNSCSRKPLFAETVGIVSRTSYQTPTCHQYHASHARLARTLVRLAASLDHCPTDDVHPLASAGVPALLAVEIPRRTTAAPYGPPSAHPADGPRQPDLGRGAHCE